MTNADPCRAQWIGADNCSCPTHRPDPVAWLAWLASLDDTNQPKP